MSEIAPPRTTNTLASILDGIIKTGMSGGDIAVEAYITAQIPIFANPILQYFLDLGVESVGNVIYQNMANVVNKVVFQIQTDGENSAVLAASKAAQAAQASGDLNAIAKTNADLVNALGNLIHSDGTATP